MTRVSALSLSEVMVPVLSNRQTSTYNRIGGREQRATVGAQSDYTYPRRRVCRTVDSTSNANIRQPQNLFGILYYRSAFAAMSAHGSFIPARLLQWASPPLHRYVSGEQTVEASNDVSPFQRERPETAPCTPALAPSVGTAPRSSGIGSARTTGFQAPRPTGFGRTGLLVVVVVVVVASQHSRRTKGMEQHAWCYI